MKPSLDQLVSLTSRKPRLRRTERLLAKYAPAIAVLALLTTVCFAADPYNDQWLNRLTPGWLQKNEGRTLPNGKREAHPIAQHVVPPNVTADDWLTSRFDTGPAPLLAERPNSTYQTTAEAEAALTATATHPANRAEIEDFLQ